MTQVNNNKSRVLVILGPTATGKTDLALNLAKKSNGEIISCDSRQVYQGLDIGTGKLPAGKFRIQNPEFRIRKQDRLWEMDGVKIWMYDVVSPKKQYTVFNYVNGATKIIQDVTSRGKLPIIVGGTGLYLKALLYGLPNLGIPVDQKLRNNLGKLSLFQLQNKLQSLNLQRWKKMNDSDRNNPRRLIRAIELSLVAPEKQPQTTTYHLSPITYLKIGLTAKREALYKRVDERVVNRINQGMVDEAKILHETGLTFKRMYQLGLEYQVLADYLSGKITTEKELIRIMQNKIHDFVRRQITWFKKEKNVHWFDITKKSYQRKIAKMASGWYD